MVYLPTRRRFISIAGGVALAMGRADGKPRVEDEVSATEDLMREHGIVRRVLLVYREAERRLEQHAELPLQSLTDTAVLVREFIEDYHERDEEEFVFPCFDASVALGPIVATLRRQHVLGRALTARIQQQSAAGTSNERARRGLIAALRDFARMYEAHTAYEDTIVFPAFRELVTRRELERLQELFEEKEHSLVHGGFHARVEQIAQIERSLGIELSSYSPPPPSL